jgi:hypothetical protein
VSPVITVMAGLNASQGRDAMNMEVWIELLLVVVRIIAAGQLG